LVLAAAAPYHAKVFLYGAGGDVLALGAHGLHLTGRELAATTGRTLARHGFVLASCHNRAELAHAEAVGVDLALLGPVLPTTTHPETDPLGWATAAGLIQGRHLPVYALGGMTPADAGTARDHGFAGLAMVRGLWRGGS
jgi:8-oxo-dGTP diphosphatase